MLFSDKSEEAKKGEKKEVEEEVAKESSEEESSEEEEEESEDSESSEEEEDHDGKTEAELKREKALARIQVLDTFFFLFFLFIYYYFRVQKLEIKFSQQKRREEAVKKKSIDDLRAAVICVLGHVDTGNDFLDHFRFLCLILCFP